MIHKQKIFNIFQVHQDCVQRWIREQFRENGGQKVHCPQCKMKYKLVYGKEPSKYLKVNKY